MNSLIKSLLWRNQKITLQFILIACMIFLCVKFVSVALTNELTFDGAQTAQVAKNLVRSGVYATSYGEITIFDTKLSTGAPVVLPTAFSFFLFGVNFESAQMINAVYLTFFSCAITYYLMICLKKHGLLTILMLILLLGTPKITEYGFGLFGEGPMLFYLLLVVIFLDKFSETKNISNLRLAGLFLGLAFLTKTIALIALPALLLVLVLKVFRENVGKSKLVSLAKTLLRYFVNILVGACIPVLVFEFYKVISLGLDEYLKLLLGLRRFVFHHPGLVRNTNTFQQLLGTVDNRLDVLSSYLLVNQLFIVVVLISLLMTFLIFIVHEFSANDKKSSLAIVDQKSTYSLLFLVTLTLSWFGWWLFLGGLPWERYIFPGIITLQLSMVLLLDVVIQHYTRSLAGTRKDKILWTGVLIINSTLLVLGAGFQTVKTKNYVISFVDTELKTAFQNAGDFIAGLPQDAKVYGYGWWEAPVVAFAADRNFSNLYSTPELFSAGYLDDTYFVYDFYAYYLDDGGNENILQQFDDELVFSDEKHKIYIWKLTERPRFAFPPFTEEEKQKVDYSSIDFTKESTNAVTRNVYMTEENLYGKWAQRNSAYLLNYDGEKQLIMEVWFENMNKYSSYPVRLDLYINQTHIATQKIYTGGHHTLEFQLDERENGVIEIAVNCDSQLLFDSPDRLLSLLLKKIELAK